jgi:uncharacterized membrane protein
MKKEPARSVQRRRHRHHHHHHGAGIESAGAATRPRRLKPLLPVFLSYVLSFIYVGIYWNNHHHMFHSTEKVTGGILWANLHLLFWLSLFPFTTAWVGANHLAPTPVAVYGFVLLMAAIAYFILQHAIIVQQGSNSLLAKAIGNDWKGKISPLCYLAAIPLAFVSPWISERTLRFWAVCLCRPPVAGA